MSAAAFEPLDFHRFHREELPRRLREGNGALAARGTRSLGSLAFRLPAGGAYTYAPTPNGVDLVEGDARADTVIEIEAGLWQNLVQELDAAAGLLYGGRARCRRGAEGPVGREARASCAALRRGGRQRDLEASAHERGPWRSALAPG